MGNNHIQLVRTIRINGRAAVVVGMLTGIGILGLVALSGYQDRREAGKALATVRRLQKSGAADLALRHLNQRLSIRPNDARALALRSEILFEAAQAPGQVLGAIKAHESFIRTAPDAPGSQDARRRLVRLYLKYGDAHRHGASSQFDVEVAVLESRYRAAEIVARQLIDRGARDSESRRLLAMALDGLAVPGDRKALNDAVKEYRNVLTLDPSDVEAAERLATLYLDRLQDAPRAERVLDGLLAAQPKKAAVRLTRYRFYAKARRDAEAAAELEEAIKLSPDDLPVIISAAEHALRRGDSAGARRQLDKVSESARGDIRVLMTRGLIDFGDERPEEAVDAWRRGLLASSGTNDEVVWWLAYSLIQMGRLAEAEPLLSQYRRLAGDEAPMTRFLAAMLDERNGKPARAIAGLEQIHGRLAARWETMIQVARGRCYEALWDEMKALQAYSLALQADPAAVVPRLSIAKLRLARRPEEAAAELERGLALVPGEPALRIALAGALMQQEAARPARARDWADFDRALAKAIQSSAGSSAVVLMSADRLSLSGRPEEAVTLLEKAAQKVPRNAQVAIALAKGLSRRGRDARALTVLEQASDPEEAGDQASLRIARARTLVALLRGREAREVLVGDVEQLPKADRPQVWMALGRLETARGNLEAARTAYAEWGRLLPNDPRPRLVLLDLAFEQKDEKEVRARVEEIGSICGGQDVAYRLARAKELLAERDAANPPEGSRDAALEEAGQLVESVLSDAPELPAAQMLRAQVLERSGKIDEAINAYQISWEHGVEPALPRLIDLLTRRRRFDSLRQLQANDGHAKTQVDLLSARAFLREGDSARASRIAKELTPDDPNSPEAIDWQSRMLSHVGRLDDADASLRAVAERRPEVLEPWLALLRFQTEHKRAQAAAETLARIKAVVKTDQPERLEARCQAAAGAASKAAKAYRSAALKRPHDTALQLELARFYEDNDRPIQAEAALREALRLDPKQRPAARQLAVLLSSRAGDAESWTRAWTELGPEGPKTEPPDDRLARAVVLSRAPDTARRSSALKRLDDLIADLPAQHLTAAAARHYLVRLLLESGQAARASQIAAVSAAQGTDPASVTLYAKALIQNKNPVAAEWQLDRLAAVSPGNAQEAALRARVIWDRSRPTEAAAALENAYGLHENDPGALALGREAYLMLAAMGPDYDPVAQRLGRKLALKNPSLSWMPAAALARKGNHDEAIDLLEIAARGGQYEDLLETGRTAMTLAVDAADPVTLSRVERVLDAALNAAPGVDELSIFKAMLRHIQGRYNDEAQLYQAALERKPEHPVILNNLAWVLSEGLHRPEEGLKYIDELVKITGRNPQTLDTRGVILTRLGRYDEAVHDLQEVVAREPKALHHLHLARSYQLSGRNDAALKSRDLARQHGLSLKDLDPIERSDLKTLLDQ